MRVYLSRDVLLLILRLVPCPNTALAMALSCKHMYKGLMSSPVENAPAHPWIAGSRRSASLLTSIDALDMRRFLFLCRGVCELCGNAAAEGKKSACPGQVAVPWEVFAHRRCVSPQLVSAYHATTLYGFSAEQLESLPSVQRQGYNPHARRSVLRSWQQDYYWRSPVAGAVGLDKTLEGLSLTLNNTDLAERADKLREEEREKHRAAKEREATRSAKKRKTNLDSACHVDR